MPLPKRQPNYFNQPQARAYQPTMRDKAAGLLSGLLGDTYQGNLFSRGLLGSSGLGGGQGPIAGMGLLDMTPLGAAFALEEAGRKIGHGDRVGGVADASLAVVPIPAAARAAKGGARAMVKGVRESAEEFAERLRGAGIRIDRVDHSKNRFGQLSSYFDTPFGQVRISDHTPNQNFATYHFGYGPDEVPTDPQAWISEQTARQAAARERKAAEQLAAQEAEAARLSKERAMDARLKSEEDYIIQQGWMTREALARMYSKERQKLRFRARQEMGK